DEPEAERERDHADDRESLVILPGEDPAEDQESNAHRDADDAEGGSAQYAFADACRRPLDRQAVQHLRPALRLQELSDILDRPEAFNQPAVELSHALDLLMPLPAGHDG